MNTNQIATANFPTDAKTGLILPLSKSLGSQDLSKHRAMIAVELEVLAKKYDRFGWERDRGTAAHDRIVSDWMAALQDYPLPEVQEACRRAVVASPSKMPNEGHILKELRAIRREKAEAFKAKNPTPPEQERKTVDRETAAEILRKAGFNPQRMPKGMQA